MNDLFYKFLARIELKEQSDYILNSRDFEYALENSIRRDGYNPIEKLKELENDIDSQLLTPEIKELISNYNPKKGSHNYMEYFEELDYEIGQKFKSYGVYITKQIYEYLTKKGLN